MGIASILLQTPLEMLIIFFPSNDSIVKVLVGRAVLSHHAFQAQNSNHPHSFVGGKGSKSTLDRKQQTKIHV